jgi:molecular chaperone GrpE
MIGNTDVSSHEVVAGDDAGELNSDFHTSNSEWDEAIQLCLAHLDADEGATGNATAITMHVSIENLADKESYEVVAFAAPESAACEPPVSVAVTDEPEASEIAAGDAPGESVADDTRPAETAPDQVAGEVRDELAEAVEEWPKLEDLVLEDGTDEGDFDGATDGYESLGNFQIKAIKIVKPTPRPAQSEGAARSGGGPAVAELVAARAEIRRLELRCFNLEELHHEATKRLARQQADFDNFRRRVEREREDLRYHLLGELVTQLMPIVDNLLRASAAWNEGDLQHLAEGVELIAQQFDCLLMDLGVRVIPSVGHPFDPEIHEAVALEPTTNFPPNIVAQEILRGYRLGERVLRPAMVKVATSHPTPEESDD